MSKRLLFGHELQERLGELLHNSGFHLIEYLEEPFEVLTYERQNPQADFPDVISFYGLEEWHKNTIFASAGTYIGDGPPYSLKTLKELIPGYPHIPNDDRWIFDNEVELDKQLNDIAELIKTRLLPWFENPLNNPAGLDMRPKQVLTDAQLKEKLQEGLLISELALERAVKEGRVEDIERHKRSVEEYKDMLAKLSD